MRKQEQVRLGCVVFYVRDAVSVSAFARRGARRRTCVIGSPRLIERHAAQNVNGRSGGDPG
eukprot:7254267-Prymnesium_polylepis.1